MASDGIKTGEAIADVDSSAPQSTLGNAKKGTTSPSEGFPSVENLKMLSDDDWCWLRRLKTNMLKRGRDSIMRNLKGHLNEIAALTDTDLEKIEEFRETSGQQIDILIDVLASKPKYVLEDFRDFMKKYDYGHLLPDQMEDSTQDKSDSEEHELAYPINCRSISDVSTLSPSHFVPDPSEVVGTHPAISKPVAESHPTAEIEVVDKSHPTAEVEAVEDSHPITFQQQTPHVPGGAEGGIPRHMAGDISLLSSYLITNDLLWRCNARVFLPSNAYCESPEVLHSNCVLPVQVSPPLMIPNAQTSKVEFFEGFLLPNIVQLYIDESIRKICYLEEKAICSIFWVDLRKFHSGPGHFCYLRLCTNPITNKPSPVTLKIAGTMARVPIKEQRYEGLKEDYYDPKDEDSVICLWNKPEWSEGMPKKLFSSIKDYNITFISPHETLWPVFNQLREETERQLEQTMDTIERTLSDLVSKLSKELSIL